MKSLLRICLALVLIIVGGFLILCLTDSSEDVPNNMYVHAGTFDIQYGNKLIIDDANGFINYSVFDIKGNRIISNQYHFSDYELWYIVSDTDGSIWIHSSDIGSMLYKRSADNKFTDIVMTPELCKASPDSFRNNLPNSLKTLWNCGSTKQ